MSPQHDYVIDNSTGANVRSDINSVLQAIASNNSGSSDPSTTYAFQLFADTTNNVMKIRNSANNAFIELFQLDGTFTLEDGSASTPALAFRDDLNTGIFSSAADAFNVATGGVERLSIGGGSFTINPTGADFDFYVEGDTDANLLHADAGNDRIGIGTGSPSYKCHVVASTFQVARFESTNSNSDGAYIELFANSSSPADNDILGIVSYRGNNDASELITYSQIRGIATDVTDGTEDGDITFLTRNDGSFGERVRINSSGQVGINTSSPSRTLDVNGGIRADGTSSFFAIGGNSSTPSEGVAIHRPATSTMAFVTDSVERLRINSSGRVKIGTTSNVSPASAEIFASDAGTSGGYGGVFASNTSGGFASLYLKTGSNVTNVALFARETSLVGSIGTNGTTTTFNTTSSDRARKKNFEAWTENTLNLFKNINPQKFNFIQEDDGAEKTKGFVAQDLVDSFPEAYSKDPDDKYMFNPSGMVIYLMKAIQELEAKVAALEAA